MAQGPNSIFFPPHPTSTSFGGPSGAALAPYGPFAFEVYTVPGRHIWNLLTSFLFHSKLVAHRSTGLAVGAHEQGPQRSLMAIAGMFL